jgi:hypothetical protein
VQRRLCDILRAISGLSLALATPAACDLEYPEVVVVNNTAARILVKNPSFNGCVWNTVLAYGEATSPGRCLPGGDRVHFQKLDVEEYCRAQAEDGTIPSLCSCGGGSTAAPANIVDAGLTSAEPTWFNYQTVSAMRAGYGDFHRFEITLDDMEQDFSIPGPYGH